MNVEAPHAHVQNILKLENKNNMSCHLYTHTWLKYEI